MKGAILMNKRDEKELLENLFWTKVFTMESIICQTIMLIYPVTR